MEPSRSTQRSYEITDPAMAPLKRWIDSYVVWTDLSEPVRRDLARRAHSGEKAAIEALCNHNLRLVLSRAVKKIGRGLPLPDLIQEGWLGLRLAVQKYDPDRISPKTGRPVQFSTMATRWIDRALSYATVTQGRTVYLPHHACEHLARIAACVYNEAPIQLRDQKWLDKLAREITGDAHLRNVSLATVERLLNKPLSIDKPIATISHGGAETIKTLADTLPAPASADPTDALDFGVLLPQLVNRGVLRSRDAWMLIRFYGLDGTGGHTMPEIAQEIFDAERRAGVNLQRAKPMTREAVRQCLMRAIRILREHLDASEAKEASPFVLPSANGTLREQRKGSQVLLSPAKVKSTESPQPKQRTSSNDSSNRKTSASRAATPTPFLRHHRSTKTAKGSSQPVQGQDAALHVPYQKAI